MTHQPDNEVWDILARLNDADLHPTAPASDPQWQRLLNIVTAALQSDDDPSIRIHPATEPQHMLHRVVVQSLIRLIETPQLLVPHEREPFGRLLAKLGDPRPGVGVRDDGVPDIVWCDVPAGEFIFQHNQRLTLPAFKIAKYPVTHQQFCAFVTAPDGYWETAAWHGMDEDDMYHPQKKLYFGSIEADLWRQHPDFYYANHPYNNLTWFEAAAFCQWLSAKLGYTVRLPTQQEWEKAARGTDGRVYPYGDQYDPTKANTSQSGLNVPATVGLFPDGASPYGVLDMSGNVWEWMLNEFDGRIGDNPYQSRDPRTIKGGSFYSGVNLSINESKTTYEGDHPPWDTREQFGFRVVRPASV